MSVSVGAVCMVRGREVREGGFLEQERNALALEGLDRTVRLHLASPPEQIGGLLGTEIGD